MPPRKPDAPARHLTIAELAERMQVSVNTVYAWNRDGIGPVPMSHGRNFVRYRLEDVEEWERSLLRRQPA